MDAFKDKVALVTGAGRGIGFEICKQLVEQGAIVFLNDLDHVAAHESVEKLNEMGKKKAHALVGDSSSYVFIRSMIKQMLALYDRLDILIANAGITLYGDFLHYSEQNFNQVIRVNLFGSFFLAQAAAQQMKEQKSGGSILFTSSVTGHLAHKGLVTYGMTKAALEALARNMVIELAPYRININSIAPGATLTERTAEDARYKEAWDRITPDGHVGTVRDMAHAALFFVHEQSRHITGQNIVVDGGWTSIGVEPDL